MKLEQILKDFGLGPKKSSVYLAALQVGSGTAQEIARKAGIPRTTAHEILQSLKLAGLVNFSTRGRTQIYTAEKPTKLRQILLDRQSKLERAMPELLSLYKSDGARPSVRVYEGAEGVKTVFEDTLTASNKKLYGILSMEDLYDVPGKRYMDDYVRRRISAGIQLHVLRSQVKEIEETWPTSAEELRQMRYTPKGYVFPMTVYLYDQKVALIGAEREQFGMIVESNDFYLTIKQLFDIMWEVSRAVK